MLPGLVPQEGALEAVELSLLPRTIEGPAEQLKETASSQKSFGGACANPGDGTDIRRIAKASEEKIRVDLGLSL